MSSLSSMDIDTAILSISFSGISLLLIGLMTIGAYSYLIYMIKIGNADLLPKGRWLWWYPFLRQHIDQYRNELYNSLPLVLD